MAAPRPSTSLGYATPSLIPRRMSTGLGALSRSTDSAPGSGSAPALNYPSSSSTMGMRTLKRSSGQAGLQTPSTVKRPHSSLSAASLVPQTPSESLAALRADLEATGSVTALQRQLTSAQRENNQVLRELGALQERVKYLEKERSILLDRQERALEKDNSVQARQDEERKELIASLGEFRSRCSTLEEEVSLLVDSESKARHARDVAEHGKANIDAQMQVLQDELVELENAVKQVNDDKSQLYAAQEEIAELKKQLAVLAGGERALATQDRSVTDVLRKELHHQVTHLKTLEHSNARLNREITALRNERQSVELLKEEKHTLEVKLQQMNDMRVQLAKAEGIVHALQREKDAWASYLAGPKSAEGGTSSNDSPSAKTYTSPAQMAKELASSKIDVLSLREQQGALQASIHARDTSIAELEDRLSHGEQQIEDLRKQLERQNDARRATERSSALDRKELEMLREQIATYATEEAAMASTGDAVPPQAYDFQKSLRIQHLEELLIAHKQEGLRALKEADRLRGILEARGDETAVIDASLPATPTDEKHNLLRAATTPSKAVAASLSKQLQVNEELQETLRTTQAELSNLQLEIDSLDAQIDTLNSALGRGEYNISTTKVYSLSNNPAAKDLAVRTETLDRLKEENRILLERVAELDRKSVRDPAQQPASTDKQAVPGDSVPTQTFVNLQAELQKAEEVLEQERKSRIRLKEIFSRTAQEFREACRRLLGYKLEPIENGRIKLTSVFGGSDYTLIFGPSTPEEAATNGSKYQLVGGHEAFVTSQRVQTGLQFWVAERGCIPGFLSTVTLELFEESTRGRTAGWTDWQQ